MGDFNQSLYVERLKSRLKGPVLEIGSKNYGSTQDFRSMFQGEKYIGIDMTDGPGVDVVVDMTESISNIREKLNFRFNTIICMSVMEHCKNPFLMANNISELLEPGGFLLLGVPFSWEFHGYPDDYWRFTPSGVRELFPQIDFDEHESKAFSSLVGDCAPLDKDLMKIRYSMRHRKKVGFLGALTATFLRKSHMFTRLFGYPYVFPPVMLNMAGRKRA